MSVSGGSRRPSRRTQVLMYTHSWRRSSEQIYPQNTAHILLGFHVWRQPIVTRHCCFARVVGGENPPQLLILPIAFQHRISEMCEVTRGAERIFDRVTS